jgi:MFS family permease
MVAGLFLGMVVGLLGRLLGRMLHERTATRSRLTLVWPSAQQQRRDFLGRVGHRLSLGLTFALVFGLFMVLSDNPLLEALVVGLLGGLGLGLGLGLVFGLVETRSVLVTPRTPKEASSRSLIAALFWLLGGLLPGLLGGWAWGWVWCCTRGSRRGYSSWGSRWG